MYSSIPRINLLVFCCFQLMRDQTLTLFIVRLSPNNHNKLCALILLTLNSLSFWIVNCITKFKQ